MSGSWLGINIASSGLFVNQKAMETIGNNIANANTPGFKRQRVIISEGNPASGAYASGTTNHTALGTGARVEAIQRVQDEFIEFRLRGANSSAGFWQMMDQRLGQIESLFAEPSDTAIQGYLDKFWNAWQDLSANPESIPLRTNVVRLAETLSARIKNVYSQTKQIRYDIDFEIDNLVEQINRVAKEIAAINQQIGAANALNESPNALLDKRDYLVTELSKLVDVTQFGRQGNDFIVNIGGKSLVTGTIALQLKTVFRADGHKVMVWAEDDSDVNINSGKIAGLINVRDNYVPEYLRHLDQIAETLVNEVNALHRSGKDFNGRGNIDFFVAGSKAADIAVNPDLVASPRGVVVSETGKPGDNSIALKIADLRESLIIEGLTINGAYNLLVSRLGSDTRIAKQQGEAHDLIARQFVIQQQSVSGVSLDEEMTDMIRFQQAYNAAARVMTAMDEMLGVIVDKLGTFGR